MNMLASASHSTGGHPGAHPGLIAGDGIGPVGGEFLTFRIGSEEYGIDILRVQEIRSYEAPTRIANAPDFIKGVVNLRGVIVPIVDLRIKFALAEPAYDAFTRQWFEQVVLPEFKLWDLKVTKPAEGQWVVEGTLENAGTGTVSVEVAALGAEPVKDADAVREKLKDDPEALRRALALLKPPSARTTVSVGTGERKPFRIACAFEPLKAQVDPDVHLLQVRRKLAESPLPKP